jgi:putative transposase
MQVKPLLIKLFRIGNVPLLNQKRYNTLAYCQELYQQGEKKPKYTELSKRLTQIKKTEEKVWLSEVFSIPLQQSLRDLETAYSNFFASC